MAPLVACWETVVIVSHALKMNIDSKMNVLNFRNCDHGPIESWFTEQTNWLLNSHSVLQGFWGIDEKKSKLSLKVFAEAFVVQVEEYPLLKALCIALWWDIMYTTRLITMPCGSCTDAPSLLGRERKRSGIQEVPVVFNPMRGACSTSIVIPKGFVGLVNRHGRYVGKWEAGFKWAPPWVTISHLVPTQYVVYDTPVKECPTQVQYAHLPQLIS